MTYYCSQISHSFIWVNRPVITVYELVITENKQHPESIKEIGGIGWL